MTKKVRGYYRVGLVGELTFSRFKYVGSVRQEPVVGNESRVRSTSGERRASLPGGAFIRQSECSNARPGIGKGYDRTYDFGRYRATWSFMKSQCEGILRVWNNANTFMTGQQKKGDVQALMWQTSSKSDQAVIAFLDEKILDGEKIATTAGYTSYKLNEDYSLLTNNCTTITMDGIAAAVAAGAHLPAFGRVRDENDPGDVYDEVAEITKEEEEAEKKNHQ